MGIRVLGGHSTDGEWLAHFLTASDSTAALTRRVTTAPRRQTLLAVLFVVLTPSEYPSTRREFWLLAQHDTQSQEVLAMMNAEADTLARRGAARAQPYTVPLLDLLPHRVIAHVNGAIVMVYTRTGVYGGEAASMAPNCPVRSTTGAGTILCPTSPSRNTLHSGDQTSLLASLTRSAGYPKRDGHARMPLLRLYDVISEGSRLPWVPQSFPDRAGCGHLHVSDSDL